MMEERDLLKQFNEMTELLRVIAYPKRGTDEQTMDIQDAAQMIMAKFSLEELEILRPDTDLSNNDAAHARMWHSEAMRLAKKYNEKTFYN